MKPALAAKLGMNSVVFEGLQHRARVPAMLRDLVRQGAVEVNLTMSSATALRMADDLQTAIEVAPLGREAER